MSAKRQAHKRHQFTVEGLLADYSMRLSVSEPETAIAKTKPAPLKKGKQPDASSNRAKQRVADNR
jgi:hypothetical protein